MQIIMIRHGMTVGNLQNCYIGSTDEALCPEGIQALSTGLKEKRYPEADVIYASPLQRCVETAEMLYPDREIRLVDEFRECSFGIFENQNYEELKEVAVYQQWLNSGGEAAFPGGETKTNFVCRCEAGMNRLVREWRREPEKWHNKRIAFIVHGGTIMALLSVFDSGRKSYYEYQVKNGEGYVCEAVLSESFILTVTDQIMLGGDRY